MMRRIGIRARLAVLGAVAVVALAGCTLNGGGYITSVDGVHKATFGFTANCNGPVTVNNYPQCQTAVQQGGSVLLSGTYQDPYWSVPVNLQFKGTLGDFTNGCFDGELVLYSSPAGSGYASVSACDYSPAGPSNNDTFSITIYNGPYGGYSNSGTLQGGNLHYSTK